MAEDPALPLTDVQFVLGHAQLSTTQIYLTQGSGIAADERETAGQQVSMVSESHHRSACDSGLTRTDRHLIASGGGYARPPGRLRLLAEQQNAAAPLPLLGALSAPAVRVGLPMSHMGA
jgi:hypothetical protein